MRRAKIVCTLGPAVSSDEKLAALIDAGMNVARINMSHGTHEEHEVQFNRIRKLAEERDNPVAILADLQGPKIRLGVFKDHQPVELANGATFVITTDDIEGTAERASTTYKGLPGDSKVGDPLLIDDGKVTLRITNVTDTDVTTRVEVGGPVSDHKGINLPGVAVSVPALSEKDEEDLRWALRMGADWIALSFVRSAEDYEDVQRIMREENRFAPVIAKIEKPQAVENLVDIVGRFDAIMVARGDLGVDLPLEEVPMVQKRAIGLARRYARPVIVATQVFESMITNPRPTRAEASDCANAVLDGADAVMLSGETSVGDYPIEAVKTMASIIETTEKEGFALIDPMDYTPTSRSGVVTKSATQVAKILRATQLVALTQSGDAAHRLSRLRPETPLVALTPFDEVCRQLSLSWGVHAYKVPMFANSDEVILGTDKVLAARGLAKPGEAVVIVSGAPMGIAGTINQVQVHRIGELDNN
jgi:pyruvate kinase